METALWVLRGFWHVLWAVLKMALYWLILAAVLGSLFLSVLGIGWVIHRGWGLWLLGAAIAGFGGIMWRVGWRAGNREGRESRR